MLGVYTIVGTVDHGWGSAHTLGFGAAAVALLAGFVARQATASRPLVPLRIFRSRNVSGANVVQALMVAGMFGMFFMGTLYLQRVLGYDAVQTGAAFLPVSVGIGVLSLGFSARLITRFGARAVLLPGLVALVAGLVLLTGAPVGGDYVTDLLPALVLLGVGAGIAFPALVTLAMSGATAADSGLASGLVNTTQQVGGALGLAVLATLSSSRSNHLLADGESAGVGAHRRLPPGLRHRRRARGRRDRGRGAGPALRARRAAGGAGASMARRRRSPTPRRRDASARALTATMKIGLLSARCRARAANACWTPPSTCSSARAITAPG